jgi:GntR family transcriptional regulator of arabinose operon
MPSIPLYKRIQEDIKTQIAAHVLRPGDRIPSESEMMKHYFVSSITVKNALSGLVDEGIIYRLKGKGSFVAYSPFAPDEDGRQGAGYTIGAVFSTLSTRVQQLFLIGIEHLCRERNDRVLVGITGESPKREIHVIQDFIQSGISALILVPTVSEINNAVVRQLVARKFPLVFMDRYLPDVAAPHVVADNEGGAQSATDYLIERCGGDIAICYFPLYNTAVSGRYAGFSQAMERAGCAITPANQCMIDDTDIFYAPAQVRVKRLYQAMLAHFKKYPQLNGAFAANAEIAQVLHLTLRQLGRTPGADFELISFDNPHLRGVSFVQQDHKAMTEQVIRLMRAQLDGQPELQSVRVPTRLVQVKRCSEDVLDMRYLVAGLNPYAQNRSD